VDRTNRHTLDTYGFRPGAEQFPLMVVITLTYRCNAECGHCPYTHSDIRAKYADTPFMPPANFMRVADEVGTHRAILRVSGGGEPMLHPDAVELLTYAKKRGCRIGLITNGSAFTGESSRALVDAGVDMIEFSVDAGDQASYERVRAKLKWDRLVRNVTRLLELRSRLRSPTKIVASGISQKGILIDEVERFWRDEIGVDAFIQRKFLTWGVSTRLDYSMSADVAGFIEPQTTPCPYPFERLFVDAKGFIMPCVHDLAGNHPVGHIADRSIAEIWLGDELCRYREKHLALRGREIPLCSTCPDWKYRTWSHPYYRVVSDAERVRLEKLRAIAD
jgi:MoaA/NifB/PqqE/SkfB family radical SAM enzyme